MAYKPVRYAADNRKPVTAPVAKQIKLAPMAKAFPGIDVLKAEVCIFGDSTGDPATVACHVSLHGLNNGAYVSAESGKYNPVLNSCRHDLASVSAWAKAMGLSFDHQDAQKDNDFGETYVIVHLAKTVSRVSVFA